MAGGPSPHRGYSNLKKCYGGWIGGSRSVFNGVKILALSSAQLQINEFKFYFLKFLNLIFSISDSSIFPKISGNVEGSIVYRFVDFKEN